MWFSSGCGPFVSVVECGVDWMAKKKNILRRKVYLELPFDSLSWQLKHNEFSVENTHG
jgi:hypothetical protein